ncbi:MAG: MBL fold metallo-hydrolase [Rhodospirillales bacterium]|nr:MBL fold metallo-hydrolase [Rhodospirillales bacterium]
MIFRQLFEPDSCTYTYLLASRVGGEALIIDPVLEKVERYIKLLEELDLKLVKAVDTHTHADHITGLGALRDLTRCVTVMGDRCKVDVVSMRVCEGDTIDIESVSLDVLETPGHTDDSYSFMLPDRIFSGDTLLIRGTGRTDFQNGDPAASYDSLFNKLLKLPDEVFVYPAHDYKGDTRSTIGEEKAHNPRLQVGSIDEYVDIMNNLNLPNPKQMDVAVPANLRIGYKQADPVIKKGTLAIPAARALWKQPDHIFVDLREDSERKREGVIPGSVHAPYIKLDQFIKPGGLLNVIAEQTGKTVVLYCAFGERSAMALKEMDRVGIAGVKHVGGGFKAWRNEGAETQALIDDN